MKNTKILFMGTPIFASQILDFLIQNNFNIVGVVSQPDKKVGRKRELKNTPVKEVALKNDIKVYQPLNIKQDNDFLNEIKPDLIITVAYGQIVPQEVLQFPNLGCINVHGSLLPKYRGGAPIHHAIINGDLQTGVTIMEMVQKMDAGDIISQQAFPIKQEDTLKEVHDNMIEVAKELLIKTLPSIVNKSYTPIKQEESKVIYSPNIKPEEEIINWDKPGEQIYNQIRGMNPWPVAYSKINNKRFKFYTTKFIKANNENGSGTISKINEEGIFINVKGGALQVIDFQIEGKKKVNIKDFINGNSFLKVGDEFV